MKKTISTILLITLMMMAVDAFAHQEIIQEIKILDNFSRFEKEEIARVSLTLAQKFYKIENYIQSMISDGKVEIEEMENLKILYNDFKGTKEKINRQLWRCYRKQIEMKNQAKVNGIEKALDVYFGYLFGKGDNREKEVYNFFLSQSKNPDITIEIEEEKNEKVDQIINVSIGIVLGILI